MGNNFSISQTGVADYNQKFLDALEFVDNVIQKRQFIRQSVWRSMIPRGVYNLGEGLTKKAYRFHPGIGDQRGLQRWDPIQISRVAAGEDPGYDACAWNPYLVDYGFQSVNYTGFQTARRTKHICIRDIRFTWQFKQQLNLIMSFLADITNSVWENAAREQYIKFANDNSNIFLLTNGTARGTSVTYDPFSTDDDGDNVITITGSNKDVSTIHWDYMRYVLRYLQMQAPEAALGNVNGKPHFGIVMDLEDIDKMIELDEDLREDYRYASPEINIQNYGMVKSFKGFTLMHDVMAPRFAVKTDDGTTLTLKRIDPMVAANTTEGQRYNVNNAYLDAEFAMAIVFMNKVFQFEIPPAGPSNPGGATMFGATPSLNGEFVWKNIEDEEHNIFGENGFYIGRYEYFPKPLAHDEDAHVIVYRRCPHSTPTNCDIGGTDAVSSPATGTGSAAAVSGSTTLVTLSTTQVMDVEPPKTVTITVDGGTGYTCIVADASDAPNYVFAAQSASDATAIINGSTFSIAWS